MEKYPKPKYPPKKRNLRENVNSVKKVKNSNKNSKNLTRPLVFSGILSTLSLLAAYRILNAKQKKQTQTLQTGYTKPDNDEILIDSARTQLKKMDNDFKTLVEFSNRDNKNCKDMTVTENKMITKLRILLRKEFPKK